MHRQIEFHADKTYGWHLLHFGHILNEFSETELTLIFFQNRSRPEISAVERRKRRLGPRKRTFCAEKRNGVQIGRWLPQNLTKI